MRWTCVLVYVPVKDKHKENTDTSDLFAIVLTIEDGSDIKQLLSFVKFTGTTSKLILNFVLLSAFLSTSCCCSTQISSPTLLQRGGLSVRKTHGLLSNGSTKKLKKEKESKDRKWKNVVIITKLDYNTCRSPFITERKNEIKSYSVMNRLLISSLIF